MTLLKDLREFEARHYVVAVGTALLIVGPGFLCIFYYRPDLVSSLDVVKLLIGSASLGLPLAALNFILIGSTLAEYDDDAPLDGAWALATGSATLVLYFALYGAFSRGLSFAGFTHLAGWLELIVLVVCAVAFWRAKRAKPGEAV